MYSQVQADAFKLKKNPKLIFYDENDVPKTIRDLGSMKNIPISFKDDALKLLEIDPREVTSASLKIIQREDVIVSPPIVNGVVNVKIKSITYVVLTRKMFSDIFLQEDLNIPTGFNMSFMTINGRIRIGSGFVDREDETWRSQNVADTNLYILIRGKRKKVCLIKSSNYLTYFSFSNFIDDEERTHMINKLTLGYSKVAVTKKNISAIIQPVVNILPGDKFIILDLFTTSQYCKYIIVRELEEIMHARRNSVVSAFIGKLITVNVQGGCIEFNTSQKSPFNHYYQFRFAVRVLSNMLASYQEDREYIIQSYRSLGLNVIEADGDTIAKRLKRIDKLQVEEPDMYIKGYSTFCQYDQQPYIVQSPEEFKRILVQDGKTLQQHLEEDNLDDKYRGEDIKPYLMYYPPIAWETNEPKLYACIPRDESDARKDYRFPGLKINTLSNATTYTHIPCCYKNDQYSKKSELARILDISTGSSSRGSTILNTDKVLRYETLGKVNNYIKFILGTEPSYRKNIGDIDAILSQIVNYDYQNNIHNMVMNGLITSNIEEKIRILSDVTFEQYLYLISFLLQRNLVLLTKYYKFNTSLLSVCKIYPYKNSTTTNSDFIFIIKQKNKLGQISYEVIITDQYHSVNTIYSCERLNSYGSFWNDVMYSERRTLGILFDR